MDEIEEFWNARYLSAGEAAWRIMGFHVTKKEPAVTPLPIHLPDAPSNYYRKDPTLSKLSRYFLRPAGTYVLDGNTRQFDNLTYADYYTHFRLVKYDPDKDGSPNYFIEQPNDQNSPRMHVVMRTSTRAHVTRIHSIRPSQAELFALRTILQTRPCRSFSMARTVGNVEHTTFQEAATDMGLFADTDEATYAVLEGICSLRTPRELRILFVHLLVNECVTAPVILWETFQENLSYDFILQNNGITELGINLALDDLAHLLEEYGKCLSDFGLPEATIHTHEVMHEILRWTSFSADLQTKADSAIDMFNEGQSSIYSQMLSVTNNVRCTKSSSPLQRPHLLPNFTRRKDNSFSIQGTLTSAATEDWSNLLYTDTSQR